MNARVRQTGSVHDAAAVQQQRLQVVGKIRPGVKVPTAKARAVAGVMDAYTSGIEAGATYDDIALAMKKIKGCPAYPLTPKNAPYFRVHPSDFAPGQAEKIMDLYATKRPGDSEPRLYSFPVVFPSDDLDIIFREQFEAWRQSEIIHWSENGQCMQRQQVKPDQNRRKRQWGGRPTESVGPCEPNSCDLFGNGDCKHMGSLYFWVPGVTGVGVIELGFTSLYASMGIMEVLEMVLAGMGRVKGTLGGKPVFTVSKNQQDVSVMDWQTGKAKRQGQQIIRLEASGLDMCQVLAAQESPLLEAPKSAARIAGPAIEQEQERDDTVIEYAGDDDTPEPEPDTPAEVIDAETGEVTAVAKPEHTPAVIALRKQVMDLLKPLDWSTEDLKEFVVGNYGSTDAMHDQAKLEEIIVSMVGVMPTKAATAEHEAPY